MSRDAMLILLVLVLVWWFSSSSSSGDRAQLGGRPTTAVGWNDYLAPNNGACPPGRMRDPGTGMCLIDLRHDSNLR